MGRVAIVMLAEVPLNAAEEPRHPPTLRFEKGNLEGRVEFEDTAQHQRDQRQLHRQPATFQGRYLRAGSETPLCRPLNSPRLWIRVSACRSEPRRSSQGLIHCGIHRGVARDLTDYRRASASAAPTPDAIGICVVIGPKSLRRVLRFR